jgi:hypothetical protein|tara:strand:+ start:371 stop:1147 length:777 start_codon:yes stop_codon:yes gene_type:complete
MADNQYAFPTEVLSLPSKGKLYSEDSPLSSGTIEVKYMTAKEEDILTSANLIEKGVVIDRLLTSVIADPKVKLDDLLIGDKNALMLGTRVLGYGPNYDVLITDPDTGLEVEHSIDLTKLETKELDDKIFNSGVNKFEFELPNSKRVIEFKMLTHKDERDIEAEVKGYKKISQATGVSNELTTRLKKQIISVDGETDKSKINDFVDNQFLARDTREFRKYQKQITPDIIFETEYTSQIGEPHKVNVPIGVRFFWPESEI